MKVFIANFGFHNFLWPECRERPSAATLDVDEMYALWVAGDRKAYVARALTQKATVRGDFPTPAVASRWFGLLETINETAGDIWVHREKDELWWTTSRPEPVDVGHLLADNPHRPGFSHVILHKPTEAWSDRNRKGARLSWAGLHPKAREFMFTEGTLQQLQPDNAAYALALIDGGDLSPWHDRPLWKAKELKSGRGAVETFDARAKAIMRMVLTARDTALGANGQQVSRTVKNKELRFTEAELRAYLDDLIADQDGLCTLTGIPLQFDGDHEDAELLASLDRIDSDGHYERGNLQVVCRFANRWKNDRKDAEFRRLVSLVRSASF